MSKLLFVVEDKIFVVALANKKRLSKFNLKRSLHSSRPLEAFLFVPGRQPKNSLNR